LRPSCKEVGQSSPRLFMRVTSKIFTNCPSGFVESQQISPENPVSSRILQVNSRMEVVDPELRFTGSEESYCSRKNGIKAAMSPAYTKSRVARPVPQAVTDAAPLNFAS